MFVGSMIFLTANIGLRIDGVQMERNAKGLFKGTAIVAFQHPEEYEMAIKTDLSSVHP